MAVVVIPDFIERRRRTRTYDSARNNFPDVLQGVKDDLATKAVPFVHNQPFAAKVWTIQHDLGNHPTVFVTDLSEQICIGSIHYVDDMSLTITFTSALAGTARLV